MASRVKKMFHRRRDDDSEDPKPARPRATVNSDPIMRTSLYESTTAAGLPQTGDYPIKGNDSSVALQAGRKSSVRSLRSRRSSSRGSQYNTNHPPQTSTRYDSSRVPTTFSPQPSYTPSSEPYSRYHDSAVPNVAPNHREKRSSSSPLPQEFANLSLGGSQAPTTVTQTVTTTRTGYQGDSINKGIPHTQLGRNHNANERLGNIGVESSPQATRPDQSVLHSRNHAPQDTVTARNASRPEDQRQMLTSNTHRDYLPPNSKSNTHVASAGYGEYDTDLAQQKPIPRKQVGASAKVPYSSPDLPDRNDAQIGHGRQKSASKALPSIPVSSSEAHRTEASTQPSSILNRTRPITRGSAEPREAHDIVQRAKSNTYDTEVIEEIAPAVVHENVSKDVHHIREEVVTREIHTHDVYHRILPVIDVEVLPPRHFLPVEGGGLVEVSASEVPGRGQNWVIAETASKIPSDQAAPTGRRRFTARDFPGQEGDAVRYIAPEGHEKTEQTWVHPPELEEGARLTGQSWPMVFGDDSVEEGFGPTPSKITKRKSPKKGSAVQAGLGQWNGGLVR